MPKVMLLFVPLTILAACSASPDRTGLDGSANSAGAVASDEVLPLDRVRPSQQALVSQHVANTEISVRYSRPVARGRNLFGALVPFDQPWNPGADDATTITVSRSVTVNGGALPAGTYSIWAIPREEAWTVMFSRAAAVSHSSYPGEALDALRLDVKPETAEHAEVLSFEFPLVEGKNTVLRCRWGPIAVPLMIAVQ